MRFIHALVSAYEANGVETPKLKAVEGEYKVACESTTNTYQFNMQKLLKAARRNSTPSGSNSSKTSAISQMSIDEQFDAVSKLVHSKQTLSKNEYVVEIPTRDESSQEPLDFSMKKCGRCQTEFRLKNVLEVVSCKYHERKKRRENTGVYWECCSELVGESQGCKESKYHVFKAVSGLEMHELIPFVKTPRPKSSINSKRIIGLDCEMGYTSKGLELIRLTVVDFYTGETIFDEVLNPYGEVLDLNTQWSGVSSIPSNAMTLSQLHQVLFHRVLDSETIIVGHGLENDLNTMRLVHHNVVDTAIVFPKGTYHKYSLKDLAFQMLDRKIQTGEHSSEEDSLAAIDIIKAHISK